MNELRIAKKDKSAFSTNPNDFIFHSSYNTFKIIHEDKLLNQTITGHPQTITVPHGLDYVPNFYAFAKFPDGKVVLAGPLSSDFTVQPEVSDGYGSFTPEVDDTNLYFIFDTSFISSGFPGNYNVNIKWYIFEAPLT